MLERFHEFVCKFAIRGAVNGFSTFPSAGGVAALNHKPLDIAMKDGLVIVPARTESEKISGGTRGLFAIQL